jgi:hypothetical protein
LPLNHCKRMEAEETIDADAVFVLAAARLQNGGRT